MIESPQVVEQLLGVPLQEYPFSDAHAALHPSPPVAFPSSQLSNGSMALLPQLMQEMSAAQLLSAQSVFESPSLFTPSAHHVSVAQSVGHASPETHDAFPQWSTPLQSMSLPSVYAS